MAVAATTVACKYVITKTIGVGVPIVVVKYGIPFVLATAGFTPAGVAAGSFAALWQSGIGNVAAGSVFSTLQSLGAAGLGAGKVGCVIYASAGFATDRIISQFLD